MARCYAPPPPRGLAALALFFQCFSVQFILLPTRPPPIRTHSADLLIVLLRTGAARSRPSMFIRSALCLSWGRTIRGHLLNIARLGLSEGGMRPESCW